MSFRSSGMQVMAVSLAVAFWVSPLKAQSNQSAASANAQADAQATSKVSAEMVKGKLNPATSKVGDQVVVRMKDDVKSNGQVVLKKGSEVTGVVRSVKRAEGKADAKGGAAATAQSMMQVEWLTPAGSGAAAQQLNLALQSIAYTNPLHAHQQAEESGAAAGGIAAPRPAAGASRPAIGGLVGGATSVAGGVASGVAGGASSTVGAAGNVGGAAGALAAPTPVPAGSATATSLQSFGVSSNQLVMVGHGQAVSAGGTSSSMDIFTHMSNDAVITSPSKDFEIASGAQMQFMVSARRQK